MSFFKKLKDRLFRSSSKLEEGIDHIVKDGGLGEPEGAPEPTPEHEVASEPTPKREVASEPTSELEVASEPTPKLEDAGEP
ncbi:MAG: signal recognition particle-docking protein FtsY, partial [Rhodobacteraceae bacterium]|nr:signal recognition particle-docking protein FtsY [Paracoccaceae bacterium]